MINTQKTHELLLRDGSSQQDRYQQALNPDYAKVEDRSIEEMIVESQRLAKELQFFNEDNQATTTWESFLIDDPVVFGQNSPVARQIQQKQWARQLASYIENPDHFINDSKRSAKLSNPHSVLFLSFLKLLNHLKAQINGLTERHLDFYFRERLGLTPKAAVPDVVNVLLELAENIDQIEIKKGTVLLAGEDEEGNELHYTVDKDATISKASIAQLKNVFVEKEIATIKHIHRKKIAIPDEALTHTMQLALGNPNPGDSLPVFPNDEIKDIFELHDEVQKGNEAAVRYITEELFLREEDFNLIFQKNQKQKDGVATDWQDVYNILDQAFKEKLKNKRQQELKKLHESKGFDLLLQHVYGSPSPGDKLPIYKGSEASFSLIFDDLQSNDANKNKEASDYIEEELKISKQDFIHIVQTSKDQSIPEANSEAAALQKENRKKAYKILELADRQVRRVLLPSPVTEEISDIYAAVDAKANTFSQYGDEEESERFKTFGSRPPLVNKPLQPANIGFGISSPTLLLNEGKRQITVLIDLGAIDSDKEVLSSLFDQDISKPFLTHLSGEEGWLQPKDVSYTIGDYLGLETEGTYGIPGNNEDTTPLNIGDEQVITISQGEDFNLLDIGKYLVYPNGDICKIIKMISTTEVTVVNVGSTDDRFDGVRKFITDQVYLNSLKVNIRLTENDAPITPLGVADTLGYVQSEFPSVVFSLNHTESALDQNRFRSSYQKLMQLVMNKVHLEVKVGGLSAGDTGIQKLTLQNDQNSIDSKKPFEPFGFEPEVGSNFYFANEEISQKKLHHLDIDLQWLKSPVDFKEYYENYWRIQTDKKEEDFLDSDYVIKSNDDFKSRLFFHDRNAEIPVTTIELFSDEEKVRIDALSNHMQKEAPEYQYTQDVRGAVGEDEVLDWDRYFRLELDPVDFQNSIHNTLFTRQALSAHDEIKKLIINPPYQPKLKNFRIGYTAYSDMNIATSKATDKDTMYHINPFGYKELHRDKIPSLLPIYNDEGTLFIGISQCITPQILSVLFQMAEGSANPDVEKPVLDWCYLRDNEWISLKTSAILSDTTNGLLNTGIIKIAIPGDATTGDTLMSGESLHWLRVNAANNISGISDTIDIRAQVVSATFSSDNVAPSHFEKLLPANSIAETLISLSEIDTITQPFTSSKGKPAEQGESLYKRLSERLRHKNRGLTMWDYEHMILDRFPQVYKAKCLPSTEELGKVNVIVVPDIKGRLPFNPFAPKVAADTLFQIHEYLDYHTPAYAEIAVSNPFYLQVSTRCVVKFHEGFDVNFHKAKLIEEIKRFMSPWAYGDDSDIKIGGTLHASVVINFIAERPYIDYVANLKLFQSEDGEVFTDVRRINDGKSMVIPSRPDMVMVSAQLHDIDVVDENGYDEENFEGINYMIIGKDFIIPQSLI
ncbi:baseplate J/gp47 family protein [Aquimarina celericrescens]|uniref:Baseplate J/gp47 family protein n=1 Tax=Aquimarina celericrescens TaxID=1964542 RepID=A0ABW5B0N9_9FLAO|nr:baseplate J/gp47 family protein [Aquimarina celericrescens]